MADSWYEYLQGSPEQRLADLEESRKKYDAMRADPRFAGLPPKYKMAAAANSLYPTRNTEAFDDMGSAATYALEAGTRPRDTAIRAVQELASGDPVQAAGLAASAIPSAVIPGLAAGTEGAEDDWRKHGNPVVSTVLDLATDPMNYVGVGLMGRAAKAASKADDVGDAIRGLRYSADLSDLPAWVVDDVAAGLPRVNPESSMEAMLQARRMVERTNPGLSEGTQVGYRNGQMRAPMLPHEWDAAEAERFGDGFYWTSRKMPNGKRRPSRVQQTPIQPYPFDADEARLTQRQLTAQAILDKGRQNPDILAKLPPVFRLPVSDELIIRLAAEAQNPLIPIAQGAAIGAGATLGGGLAYGLAYPDEEVR